MGLVNVCLIGTIHQQFFLSKNFRRQQPFHTKPSHPRIYQNTYQPTKPTAFYTKSSLKTTTFDPETVVFLHQKPFYTKHFVAPNNFTSGIIQPSTPNPINLIYYCLIIQQTPFAPLACHTFALSLLTAGSLFHEAPFTAETFSSHFFYTKHNNNNNNNNHLSHSYARKALFAKHLLQQTPSTAAMLFCSHFLTTTAFHGKPYYTKNMFNQPTKFYTQGTF